ncbi:unnamed protein product [Cochlearia groenlandica]
MELSDVNASAREEDDKISPNQSENISKSQPHDGSKEKAYQLVEANPILAKDDTSVETIARRLRYLETDTKLVGKFKDNQGTSFLEGSNIDHHPATPLSHVKQVPDNLPSAYEWTLCDMTSDDMCTQVYEFFKRHYPDDDDDEIDTTLRESYSKEFLKWALCPPGFHMTWHIGVRAKESKKLVAFIGGVPTRIKVRDVVVVEMARINFLCVHKNLRSKRLAYVMIKELTRMVHLQNVWQALYTSLDDKRVAKLPTPITTCSYWVRYLNPKKLIDVEFTELPTNMSMSMVVKLYKLPDEPLLTTGFREMQKHHVPAVTNLLKTYLRQFGVAPDFDMNDVEHWLLPRVGVVHSYVVESHETHEVTDFCSFYTGSIIVVGNPKYKTVECAYSYYNVATNTSLTKLMKDALIVSKRKGFDVFYALDVMQNESFFKELKFELGDGKMRYYLHNYRLTSALKPSQVGLVLS